MNKEHIKEVIREMFKSGEINIYVTNIGDSYEKSVETTIEVYIGEEKVSSDTSTAYFTD